MSKGCVSYVSDSLILAALARLEVGQASLQEDVASLRADVSRIDAGQASLREDLASLRTDMSRLDAKQTSLRVDIMARMDRLQNSLTGIRNDISVNFGSADAVKRTNDSI